MPELRFPEFANDGEWIIKKLGEVGENIMYGLNASAVDFDGENKYIRITDIDEETRVFAPSPLTSPSKIDEKYLLDEDDLLFARTGASVGKSYIHRSKDGKYFFAGYLIRFKVTKAIPYFIYSQTLTSQYNKWVHSVCQRSGQPGINAKEFQSYLISLPPTLAEQEKIAACLSKADE
ncbi:MAG: restriction endonuclease subunit S, partial [Leptospiraceae bacterium]|nr:restriction endonuclease subunit S [Leptospiraceae bacterium]